MLDKLLLREPLVGPIEAPENLFDDFPATPDRPAIPCQDSISHKVVRVMPGKFYEVTTELEFAVLEDVLANPPESLNPGTYFLRIRMTVTRGWNFHEQQAGSPGGIWDVGSMDSDLLKFTVKGSSRPRKT